MKTRIGDFENYGTKITEDGVMFTYSVDGDEPSAIQLYNSSNFVLEHQIDVPREYRIGNVYSVVCMGQSVKRCCYRILRGSRSVVDEYAPLVLGRNIWNDASREQRDFLVFGGVQEAEYLWKNNRPEILPADMVIYKLHMRGFTMNHGLKRGEKGNYKGLLQRAAYLKELGITSIEFQPVYDFEELMLESGRTIEPNGQVREYVKRLDKLNYWGYGSAYYMAPKASYFGGKEAQRNCKEMIDTLHGMGMEVIWEMSFAQDVTSDYMLDCLWYWVKEYRVDGFHLLGSNVPMKRIAASKHLARTKIFHDHIPQDILDNEKGTKHLFVYDDSFLCVCRQMQNHMQGSMVQFTNYLRRQNKKYGFVNYMANTSGFTLMDSYCYGEKHNWANGEENRDGNNINYSYNCGVEGETKNRKIINHRMREMRNGLCAVFLSQSVPLIQAGDEVANTQKGNNNPYCQDNSVGWVQYINTKGRKQLLEFTRHLIAFRKAHPILRMEGAMQLSDYRHLGVPDLSYHGSEPWLMGIGEERKAIGILYGGDYQSREEAYVFVAYNYHYQDTWLAIPKIPRAGKWALVMNTAMEDTFSFEPIVMDEQKKILVPRGSVAVLVFLNAEFCKNQDKEV